MKRTIKITWTRLALLPVIGVAGALLVGGSGLVSIAASSGHFAPVEWFLHWTFNRAVSTQSLPISVPDGVDLKDPILIQRAAGHFASGCAPCHGAPGELQSPLTAHMVPPPPRLEERVGEWKDRELYWLGLHGIKYSGMPSWTTQTRPDEIWSLVAFLRALPDMTPETYADLALGGAGGGMGGAPVPAALKPALAGLGQKSVPALADCARCHGYDGRGRGAEGAFPNIAGQPEAYLAETLIAYANGTRESGIMTPAAGIHDQAVLRELAAWYARQDPGPAPGGDIPPPSGVTIGYEGSTRLPRGSVGPNAPATEPPASGSAAEVDHAAAHGPPYSATGLLELGQRLAEEGLPDRKLAACDTCHGAAGREKNPHYPRLAGQPEWFLATQLQLWKDEHRGGTPFNHVMTPIAINLTEEQIDALALWYSRADPAGGAPLSSAAAGR
ncbi:c-type cytochrome [Aureimonas ureilytica]|uniref:c-type cytochrome n=1 Tax=Aureimonas ureilytica TaxID=401562 RepID=UPI0003762720|nr:c-type cytochrome [Aureimonas ureilytica]